MAIQGTLFIAAVTCLAVVSSLPAPKKAAYKPVGQCPPKNGIFPTYLPDEKDCNIFYECNEGIPNIKQCLPGLCFDTAINVCNYPPKDSTPEITPLSAVGTCPPRDTNETIYLSDSENCTIYYICSNGQAVQNVCPPDMSWNSEKHICDWTIDANCNLTKAAINVYVQPQSAIGTCPVRDGNEIVFLPDSDDCAKYYVCSNGQPIPNSCTPGMVWNSRLKTCDWDVDNDCVADGEQAANVNPLSAVGTCPVRDGDEIVFLPDSTNCTIYYICSNGRAIPASCTPGMAWNARLGICDWDVDNDCLPDGNQGLFLKDTRNPVGECPAKDGATPTYLPDSEDCHLYYECSNGSPILNYCTSGLVWNSKINTCDFDRDGDCIPDDLQTKNVYTIASKTAVGTCPEKDGAMPVYLPDSESCQIYYECDEGIPIKNNCPDGLDFNPTLHVCDNPLDAGCTAGSGTTGTPGSTSSTTAAPTTSSTTTTQTTPTIGTSTTIAF